MPEQLRKGDIDIGLLPKMAPAAGVESELLYEDAYIAVARRGHPGFGDGMSIEAFCSVPHVVLGQSRSVLDDTMDHILARQGRARHVQAAITTFAQMADLLASTDAMAVFPKRVAERYADQLDALPLPFDLPSYSLYVCWDARSNADEAVMWLKAALVRMGRLKQPQP